MIDNDDQLAEDAGGDAVASAAEPKSSKEWLERIAQAEKAFETYQAKADKIDKLYANLERLANDARDREFQMFWANVAVLGPSIYSRPPVPVVVPRFKDRRPLPRVTSELIERCLVVSLENEDIDSVMRLIRDDLNILARGCVWLRYETKQENGGLVEKACIDHADRKDFLHDPARVWKEVDWVAKRSWLTKREARKRFMPTSGKAYQDLAFEVRKDDDEGVSDDGKRKAGIWEIWCKSQNKVVWVSEGCEVVLDEGKPHLDLTGFFPCPRPAYTTVQRRTLIPVPDMAFYKDQLEEINELTGRIAALADAIKVRAFYPSGAGEISDALEAAVKSTDDNVVMVPISNWAMTGNGAMKDMIVWLPLDMIASTITQLVALRKQLFDDVYQITGLSDIMRGSTVASETLGAQQLKSQYGSIRIRDRQDELIRIARDITRIVAEIMGENFQAKTLLDMSQLEIASDADIRKQVEPLKQQIGQITAQVEKAKADPQLQQQAQANPQAAQQILQQAQQQAAQLQQQIAKVEATPTIEQAVKLLRDQKMRPFVLDIETDSTIAPDENAQKQRATEYLTAMGGLLAQAVPAIQQLPEIAPLVADTISFAQSRFRVGRSMDQTVEEFVEKMKAMASQPKPPDPAQAKAQADAQAGQQAAQMQAQAHQADMAAKSQEVQIKQQEAQARLQLEQQKIAVDVQVKQADAQMKAQAAQVKMQQDAQAHEQAMQIGALNVALLRTKIAQASAGPAGEGEGVAKPPSESIAFKDLPPEGQAQMAAQAGIDLSAEQIAAHAAEQQAEAALKAETAGAAGNPRASK